jgi:hypothetical protein
MLTFVVVTVCIANSRTLASGDTLPTRDLQLSIISESDFELDEFPFLHDELIPGYVQYWNGHIVSTSLPGRLVLALRIYFLPILAGISPHSWWLPFLEKLSATLIATLSVLILFVTLRRLASEQIAVIYALGTSTFSISRQALWQHGPAQLLLTLTTYRLVSGLLDKRLSGCQDCRWRGWWHAVPLTC